MFKKSIALFLTALMILSCFTTVAPVFAADASVMATEVVAYEDFSNYLLKFDNDNNEETATVATTDDNIVVAYPSSAITGYGWASNWSTSSTEYVEPVYDKSTKTGDKILAYQKPLYKNANVNKTETKAMLRLDMGKTAYRPLSAPLEIGNVDGVYTFSVDVMHVNSQTQSRKPFRFDVGGLFSFGYDHELKTEVDEETGTTSGETGPVPSYAVPVICVPGTDDEPAETKLIVGGGSTDPDFVTYTAILNIDADGTDTITLTARDRQTYQNPWTNVSADSSSVTVNADISGTINYIGLGGTSASVTASVVDRIEITKTTAISVNDEVFAPEEIIAQDMLDGYDTWTTNAAVNTLLPEGETVGTGFSTNWISSTGGSTALSDSIQANTHLGYRELMITGADGAYRKLSTPIVTNGKSAKYTFKFFAREGQTNYPNHGDVTYHIGDGIKVGYKWTGNLEYKISGVSKGEITPFIQVGSNLPVYGERLIGYGGYSYGDHVGFEVNVNLNASGKDFISLKAQDVTGPAGYFDTSAVSEVVTVADITDSVDYIGFTVSPTAADYAIKSCVGGILITGAEVVGEITDDAYPYLDIAEEYLGTRTEDITAYGFDGDWTANADGSGELNSTVTYYEQKKNSLTGDNIRTFRFAGTSDTAYRQLADVIYTDGRSGSYTFTFDAAEGNSVFSARSGLAYHLGEGIEVGYIQTELIEDLSSDSGLITPYIKVGGETYTNGTLTSYGNDANGEFTTYTVKVNLNADGADLITLTAKDNPDVVVNAATTSTTEAVTVTATAQLTEKIDYVGFTVNKNGTAAKTDIRNLTIKGYGEPVEQALAYPAVNVAKDTFGTDGGYTAWTGAISANLPESGTTGYGFANNWSGDAEGTTATIDKVQAATNVVKALRLETLSAAAYRKLAAPIMPKAKDGEYTFTFAASEGNGGHASRSGAAYHLGDGLEVGYNWTTLVDSGTSAVAGKITPYIRVGNNTLTNGELTTYGGYEVGEYVAFNLNIKLDADGSDLITLTVQDKETDTRDAYKNTTEKVVITAAAQLTDVIDYIGFTVNTNGNNAKIDICDIAITGTETPVVEAVNTPATTDVKEVFGIDGGYASWGSDTAISGQFKEGVVTGTGFANNWSKDAAGTEATADGVMTAAGHKINSLRLNGAVSAYRRLAAPISLAGKSGTQLFKFSSADAISAYGNRKGISYYIGKNIEVGYDWTEDITTEPVSGADAGYITPYIKINGTEIKDDNKKLVTSGNNTYGEWVDFELKVELGENGSDLLTLTVKDNTDNTISTTDATASVTLTAATDIGEAIEYIGFATKGGKTDFANIEIASSKAIENQPRTEKQWTVAEDTLNAAAGYSFETYSSWRQNGTLSAYIPSTVTKTGWGTNWAANTNGAELGTDVVSYIKSASSGTVNTIRLVKGTSAIYRSLENSINLNNADASYTFTYSTASGMSSVGARCATNFHIGDVLTVGHKWDGSLGEEGVSGDPSKLVPYIKLANGSEVVADGYLRTLGNDENGEFVTFEVKLDLFSDGLDTITLNVFDRADNVSTASADDKLTIQFAAELSGSIDYIGFTLDDSSGEKKVDFTDFKITTYNENDVEDIIAENINKMGLGYESARILDTIENKAARETLMAEFNKYGYAYEDFGGYEAATGIAPSSLDSGAGWDGAWTGTNVEIAAGRNSAAGNDLRAVATSLSRELATPIDLSVDGEYYVKVKAYVDIQSANIAKHNLVIKAGDFAFGTVGSYNEVGTDDATKYLVTPSFGTTGTAAAIDGASTYPARNYNTYVLRIVSSAAGEDTIEYFFAPDGVLAESAVVATATVTSDAKIDTISITDGAGATLRLNEVAVDCWNASFDAVKSKSVYDEGIVDGRAYTYYSDYIKAVEENDVQLPDCVTTDYMIDMNNKSFVGIIIEDCVLRNGTDETGYTNVSDISLLAGSAERNLQVKVTLNNTGLIDKDGSFQAIHMLIGYYYDGKLMHAKRQPWQLHIDTPVTNYIPYNFPEADGWPANIDYTKVDIKMFTFDWHTWAPFEYAVEFYNSRTVVDGAEKIYVDPSYEGATSDGSEAAPYKTIEEAQAHIAALNTADEYPVNGISVYIEEGNYTYTDKSLTFNSNHGGTAGAPVKFIADGEVNIVGGIAVDLDDFVPTAEGDAVYNANVVKYTAPEGTFAVGSEMFPISGHQLAYFENGTYNGTPYFTVALDADYMSLARWPNASEGYAVVDSATSVLSTKMTTTNKDYPLYDFTITDAALANKKITGENIYIHGYWTSDFADFRTTAKYDSATNTFTADYPAYKEVTTTSPAGGLIYDRRYYVSNSPDLLDAPGEWYIDGDTIYLYPTKTEGTVTIGLNTNPVISGSDVDNIVFDGININGSRNRGATFAYCDNITFKNASVTNVNDQAIAFNTCTDVLVDSCTVAYTGTGGISMGGTEGSFVNQKSENNRITNSVFHDFGLWQKGYSEAISFGGYANVVENNTIYNSTHQTISISGFDNVFRKNEMYNVVSEASDMGAIYVGKNPSQRGNIIERNYFHDIKTDSTIGLTQSDKAAGKTSADIAAIFLDDNCAGYIIRNNVFEDMGGSAIKTNGARANSVTGNVFINNNWNVRFSCNGLGYNETDGYFMWTQEKINAYTESDKESIQSGYSKYWGYIQADSAVTSGAITGEPYTKYSIANGHTENIATYYNDEPLLAKYNVFKNNWSTGTVSGDYGFREGNEEYMTSEGSGCEFVASEAYDSSNSMSSYIGVELSSIGSTLAD